MTDPNWGPWDHRDRQLDLRTEFAKLVAVKTSGLEGSVPEEVDFVIADKIGELIEAELDTLDGDDNA